MTTDFRALCAELADELHDFQWAVQEAGVGWACPDTESLIDRARAALAEPEPEGPPMFKPDEVHPFVVRHYTDDQRPSIKGNGFDGLEVGEDRQEAEEFIAWINARLFPSRSIYGLAKRDHNYEGPLDDWPKRAERAATVAGLRAAIAADRAQRHPQPVPVSERRPGHIEQALIKAECALADIAEGEAEESDGDPLEWAEKRAADALARIRPVMRQHQIKTSEWPPVPPTTCPSLDHETRSPHHTGDPMTDYDTAVDQSYSRLPGSPDWNQQFRANLRDRGLCLSVAHERGAMPERYPEGGPFFAPRPWPESTTDGWPDDAEIVWLDHPGAAPL